LDGVSDAGDVPDDPPPDDPVTVDGCLDFPLGVDSTTGVAFCAGGLTGQQATWQARDNNLTLGFSPAASGDGTQIQIDGTHGVGDDFDGVIAGCRSTNQLTIEMVVEGIGSEGAGGPPYVLFEIVDRIGPFLRIGVDEQRSLWLQDADGTYLSMPGTLPENAGAYVGLSIDGNSVGLNVRQPREEILFANDPSELDPDPGTLVFSPPIAALDPPVEVSLGAVLDGAMPWSGAVQFLGAYCVSLSEATALDRGTSALEL